MMIDSPETVKTRVLDLLRQVQERLGDPTLPHGGENTSFAEVLDSTAMLEFIASLAEACSVSPETIERCVDRQFTTVGNLAASLHAAGLMPNGTAEGTPGLLSGPRSEKTVRRIASRGSFPQTIRSPDKPSTIWLGGAAVCLPKVIESASSLDDRLGRPNGWLERHAGIRQRRVWANEDPLDAAAEAGHACLHKSDCRLADVGALLVTSEAPPVLAGLAAATHHRLKLRSSTLALEIGGACTGFLTATWMAQSLVSRVGPVLIVAIEAATRYLKVQPGEAGEGSALFGDGVAACVFSDGPMGSRGVRVSDVHLGRDGSVGDVLKIERTNTGSVEIRMKRIELAGRAIEAMAHSAQEMAKRHRLAASDLAAVVAHGGNGRMPPLLARQLGISPELVWSETATTGNLGSASIPVAWASRSTHLSGPAVWTAAGAGLTWGAALLEPAAGA
jgi:3-oxoacyl-[acyl-carrier-protein] synthase-3